MYVTVKARPTLVKLSKDEYYARYLEEMTDHLDFERFTPQDPVMVSGFNHWFTTLTVNAADFFFRYSNPTLYTDKPHFEDLIEAHATYLRESGLCPCEVDDETWCELISSIADMEERFVTRLKDEFEGADFHLDFWSLLAAKGASIIFKYEGDFRIYEWSQGRGKHSWVGSIDSGVSLPDSTWEQIGQLLDDEMWEEGGDFKPKLPADTQFLTRPSPMWLKRYHVQAQRLSELEKNNDLDGRHREE